ncbi:sulfatase [Flavobacterium faecale]|uniref:Sulfatase n=1 Tax=Flavobacterium faecale TaxID=1355330 RepID=A0A2S1LGH8_9FLAO|nr:arylsulfatase [Flavobacterium faecale]AWG22761.1 sulfatase [Flavobacterium faecale]
MKVNQIHNIIIAIALAWSFNLVAQSKKSDRPNIIVVLADDLGTGDVSYYRRLHSNTIILETPHIDKLASLGMIFTNAHAPASLCATSRYAIMTGNSCYRSKEPWGVWGGYSESAIQDDQLTLGRLMQQANYQTAFFGKWHLGTGFPTKDDPNTIFIPKRGKKEADANVDISRIVHGPTQLGFDYNVTLPAGIQNMPYAIYENDKWLKLRETSTIKIVDKGYMTSIDVDHFSNPGYGDSNWNPSEIGPLLAKKAVDYIAKNAHNEKPFFMYYCSQAVHSPHAAPVAINGVKIKGTTPSRHMDMIKELDEQVGMLVNELKAQGIYENTVIIFTSDNGGLHTDGDTWNAHHEPSDIYRGAKNDPYEGGHRVPFMVVWPGVIKENQSSDKPIVGLDIMATLAGITKQKIGTSVAQDSHNLLPVLKNEKGAKTHDFLMIQGGANKEYVINDAGWKLIVQVDKKSGDYIDAKPVSLFNLNDNITEDDRKDYINNPKYKDKIETLFAKYKETIKSKVYMGNNY